MIFGKYPGSMQLTVHAVNIFISRTHTAAPLDVCG